MIAIRDQTAHVVMNANARAFQEKTYDQAI